jgi:hypothetical protein
MKTIIQFILLFFFTTNSIAQNKLIFKAEAVDSLLIWMQNGCGKSNITNLVKQPSNQLMSQILSKREKNVPEFKKALEEFNYNDSTSGSIYLLNEAYKRQLEISELLKEIKKSNFSENVYKRAIKYFPDNYIPPRNYEVFFTALGWQWGDAMSFDYKINNGEYLLSDKGTPAIIFNLTLVSMTYGNTIQQQMKAMENIMSHELFHAILSDYTKVHWNQKTENSLHDEMFFLMLNEGIAHYIANGSEIAVVYEQSQYIKAKESNAFEVLGEKAKIIFADNQTLDHRRKIVKEGTFGPFWEKYICITGLFLIYHIEQYYGVEEIMECVKNGPLYFIKRYETLSKINTALPQLPDQIIKYVKIFDEN